MIKLRIWAQFFNMLIYEGTPTTANASNENSRNQINLITLV